MSKRRKWIFLAPLAIVAQLAFIALGGEVVKQLWNWLLPPLSAHRREPAAVTASSAGRDR